MIAITIVSRLSIFYILVSGWALIKKELFCILTKDKSRSASKNREKDKDK